MQQTLIVWQCERDEQVCDDAEPHLVYERQLSLNDDADDVQCVNALDVLVENDELLEVAALDEIDLVRQIVNTIDDDEVVVLLLYDTPLDD